MLEMQASIRDSDIGGNEITDLSTTSEYKISGSSSISEVLNTEVEIGATPFLIGKSTIGGNEVLKEEVDYYISAYLTTGSLDIGLTIYTLYPCYSITFAFDTSNNKYPSSITINSTQFTPTSSTFTAVIATNTITQSGTKKYYYNVSIPNTFSDGYPLIISGIFIGIRYSITKQNIIDLDINFNDRGTLDEPSFGLNSNSATLKIKDENGVVLSYIEKSLIGKGSPVAFLLKDDSYDVSETLAEMKISKMSYDNNTFTASFNLSDGLLDMQEINIEELYISSVSMTALQIFNYIKTYATGYVFDIKTTANNILSNTTITYPYIDSTNVWTAFYKVCNLCGLYMYVGNDGKVVVDTQLTY